MKGTRLWRMQRLQRRVCKQTSCMTSHLSGHLIAWERRSEWRHLSTGLGRRHEFLLSLSVGNKSSSTCPIQSVHRDFLWPKTQKNIMLKNVFMAHTHLYRVDLHSRKFFILQPAKMTSTVTGLPSTFPRIALWRHVCWLNKLQREKFNSQK